MKRVLCAELPAPEKPVLLAQAEADHVTRVLRLRDGDRVEAMDGKGHSAVTVLRTRGGGPRLEFLPEAEREPARAPAAAPVPVILELAILKGDAMEWTIEKAVELGAEVVVPLVTAHTVVQIRQKGPEAFRERWQKIADQALKQCGRLQALRVEAPVELEEWLARVPATPDSPRLWCDEAGRAEATGLLEWLRSQAKLPGHLRILVGPEGGWSHTERELLSRSGDATHQVSLGPWVLRAETAAIQALSLTSAHFRLA